MVFLAFLNFRSSAKKELATFFTGLKVLKAINTIIRTFDLVPKKNLQFWSLDQKF